MKKTSRDDNAGNCGPEAWKRVLNEQQWEMANAFTGFAQALKETKSLKHVLPTRENHRWATLWNSYCDGAVANLPVDPISAGEAFREAMGPEDIDPNAKYRRLIATMDKRFIRNAIP